MSSKIISLLIILLTTLMGRQALAESKIAPLFESSEPLDIVLTVDIDRLCRKREESDCDESKASMEWRSSNGSLRSMPVWIRSRGDFRKRSSHCELPPLFIRFDPLETSGTIFAGQDLLPLTLQCSAGKRRYKNYLLAEYMAYRIYAQLTTNSVLARRVALGLRRSEGSRVRGEYMAFFTEHFKHMASRNGGEMVALSDLNPQRVDPLVSSRLSLFQFLIGNTDWSIITGHNMAYMLLDGQLITPIPYDFDFAGIVDADYASVYPGLPIRSVTQRLFRGFCYDDLDWNPLYQEFQDQQDAIFELISETQGLTSSASRRISRYVKQFYEIISSPDERQKKIEDTCRK